MLTGTFVPGRSWLHRARPALKLLGMLVLTTVLVAAGDPFVVAAGALAVLLAGLGAGLGWRGVAAQVWPMRWIALVLTPVQWWTGGWRQAVVVVGGLIVAVAAAGVITATTRISAMRDTLVAGLGHLRPFGVDADRVGLLLALAVRAVPVVIEAARGAQAARVARGRGRSPRAVLVPVVVRTVRHAERVGEALRARGVDD